MDRAARWRWSVVLSASGVFALVLAALAAPIGSGGLGGGRPVHGPRPAAPHRDVLLPRSLPSGALPDSVLALVGRGPNAGRITVRDLRAAAARFGAAPDSLTPQSAREFLDVLIDQKAINAQVAGQPRQWGARDSAEYTSLRDRLELDAALDSALAIEHTRRLLLSDTTTDRMVLGIAVRDSAIHVRRPEYDRALLGRLAAAFDSLPRPDPALGALDQLKNMGRLPQVSAADSFKVAATMGDVHYTVNELLGAWKRLNPMYRPHISTPDQVKDLLNNGLYEGLLRANAKRQHLIERPDIAEALRAKAEFLDMQSYVTREVYARIPLDSLALLARFQRDPHLYDVPAHAGLLRFVFETEAEARTFMVRLARQGALDTLLAEAARNKIDYKDATDAGTDSVLTARCFAAGVGGLVGPDDLKGGWRVLRVMSLVPTTPRTFAQARDLVSRDQYDQEGERMMRALLDRLRREQGVVTNDAALRRLTAARSTRR